MVGDVVPGPRATFADLPLESGVLGLPGLAFSESSMRGSNSRSSFATNSLLTIETVTRRFCPFLSSNRWVRVSRPA